MSVRRLRKIALPKAEAKLLGMQSSSENTMDKNDTSTQARVNEWMRAHPIPSWTYLILTRLATVAAILLLNAVVYGFDNTIMIGFRSLGLAMILLTFEIRLARQDAKVARYESYILSVAANDRLVEDRESN
jgi:hypothetical protein